MNIDITSIGLLVRTSFGIFNPTRMDKAGLEEYARLHQIDKRSVKLTNALVDEKFVKPLTQLKTAIQTQVDRVTVPFDQSGKARSRIVTAALVPDVQDIIAVGRRKWENAVDDFVGEWDKVVADAKLRLNGNFAKFAKYYPEAEQVRNEFRFDVTFMPMPDWRLLGDALSAQMKDLYESNIRAAGAELRERLREKLEHLAARCAEVGGEDSKRFYESNVTNVLDLCETLPKMLVGDDPDLVAAIEQARQMLDGLDADAIKSSPLVASDIRAKAAAIAGSLL